LAACTNGHEKGIGSHIVLFQKTRPTVDVSNPRNQSIFVITRRAAARVTAADAAAVSFTYHCP
jgi:hypothetical protein